ncbi:MAG: hypothetical protein WD267_09235 [Balneolales bacterium]
MPFIKSLFYTLILTLSFVSCQSNTDFQNNVNADSLKEQQLPLSDYNIYKGETHAHTVFTWSHGNHRESFDGPLNPEWDKPEAIKFDDHTTITLNPDDYPNVQGLPANYYSKAKEKGFDFFITTDHSHDEPLQPVSIDNRAWKASRDASVRYNDDPDFVALNGVEYGRNGVDSLGIGHLNPINIAEYVNGDQREGAAPWPEADWSIPQLYDWLKTAEPAGGEGYVVASFNHPGRTQYNDWDYLDNEIRDIITMFELRTVFRGSGPRWAGFIRALNKGWKVSPISVTDSHGYWHVDTIQPLTWVLAPELTKTAITNAMRQRRTYTSWAGQRDTQVDLKYSVNGYIMGSTLDTPEAYNFQIEINTHPTDKAQNVKKIQIIRDHPNGDLDQVEVAAEVEFDGNEERIEWAPVIEDNGAKYYFLRVYHNSDMNDAGGFNEHGSTYSAPIWTGR